MKRNNLNNFGLTKKELKLFKSLNIPSKIQDFINKDYDHVITVFKRDGKWGAISKSNHVILRYREPVYNSVRELVMSYFNEYFNDDAKKTLRKYSNPVDLSRFDKKA